jgi:hypothetical protein
MTADVHKLALEPAAITDNILLVHAAILAQQIVAAVVMVALWETVVVVT